MLDLLITIGIGVVLFLALVAGPGYIFYSCEKEMRAFYDDLRKL